MPAGHTIWAQKSRDAMEALRIAALELVAEQGMRGLTLAAVGARAGVSRGLPLYHFGSKAGLVRHLLDAVLEWRVEAYAERERSGVVGLASILQALDEMSRFVVEHRIEQRGFAVLMAEAISDPDPTVRARVQEYDLAIHAVLSRNFAAELASRGMSGLQPDALATMYLGALRGMTLHWVSNGDDAGYLAAIEAFRHILTGALQRDV